MPFFKLWILFYWFKLTFSPTCSTSSTHEKARISSSHRRHRPSQPKSKMTHQLRLGRATLLLFITISLADATVPTIDNIGNPRTNPSPACFFVFKLLTTAQKRKKKKNIFFLGQLMCVNRHASVSSDDSDRGDSSRAWRAIRGDTLKWYPFFSDRFRNAVIERPPKSSTPTPRRLPGWWPINWRMSEKSRRKTGLTVVE